MMQPFSTNFKVSVFTLSLFLVSVAEFSTVYAVTENDQIEQQCHAAVEGELPRPCYCLSEKQEHVTYGTFYFEATAATLAGVVTRAECPYGVTSWYEQGLEPIPSLSTDQAVNRDTESGMTRICRLLSNPGSLSTAAWEGNEEPERCRAYASLNAISTVRRQIDHFEITPFTFRTIQPDLNLLKFWALYPKEGDYQSAKILIDAIGNLLMSYNFYEEFMDPSPARICFELLDELTQYFPVLSGYRITLESPYLTVQTAQFPYNSSENTNLMNYTAQIDNVQLKFPSEIIRQSLEQDLTHPKLRVIAYSDELFIHWKDEIQAYVTTPKAPAVGPASPLPPAQVGSSTTIKPTKPSKKPEKTTTTSTTTMAPLTFEPDNDTGLAGHWRVFAIDVLDATIRDLKTEFEYTFHPENASEIKSHAWKCVFWNETEHAWSTEGVESIVNVDSITCRATHFTAFSVLIDPLPLPIPGKDYAPIQNSVHSNILSVLSSIGSAISIVGLALVILTYGIFRVLRKERSNRILLNLSISLLLMHLISISSSKELWDGHCFVPAVLLQFFLHSSLFWMLMEAHHMHQLLISVFVKPETRFLTKRCLIAWGIPLVIVGVCAAVRPEVYYTGRHDLCIIAAYLNLPLYYGAYMAPIIIILVVNLLVFCRIFNVLYKQTAKQNKHGGAGQGEGKKSKDLNKRVAENIKKTRYVMLSPTQIKGSVTVMILVGAGWVVGLLAIGPFEVFFKYLFCITNAGQGALIFVFRVLLHPQACREWRKLVLGLQLDSSEVSTTSSTNVNTTHRKSKSFVSISPGFISASNSVENSLTPSNPDAKDLARVLATMMRNSKDDNKDQTNNNNRF